MKRKFHIIFSILLVAVIAIYFGFQHFNQATQEPEMVLDFGKEGTEMRRMETKNLSPYAIFGDSSVVLMTEAEEKGIQYLEITNSNKKSKAHRMVLDMRIGMISILDKKGNTIKSVTIKPEIITRFLSVDRLAHKYTDLSPYNYVANNPIRNIDPNGDSIVVVIKTNIVGANGQQSIQTSKYYYGQHSNGTYGFLDNQGSLYAGNNQFVGQVATALGDLRQGGAVGQALVDNLMTHANSTEIVQRANNGAEMTAGNYVTWNPNGTTSAPDQTGATTRPSYVGLGHELAHIQDIWQGTINNNTWQTVPTPNGSTQNIPNAEIYATHIENQIRAENGLSLRVSYGVGPNNSVDEATRIIRRNTNQSLYYDNNGNTNYRRLGRKQTPFGY